MMIFVFVKVVVVGMVWGFKVWMFFFVGSMFGFLIGFFFGLGFMNFFFNVFFKLFSLLFVIICFK